MAGPAAGLYGSLIEALISDDMEDKDRARLIRRAVPWNNLLFWDETLRELSNALAEGERKPGRPAGEPLDDWEPEAVEDEPFVDPRQQMQLPTDTDDPDPFFDGEGAF